MPPFTLVPLEQYDDAFWQDGQAGQCNIITYNGEDIRGVAYVPDAHTRMRLIDAHNKVVRRLREGGPEPQPFEDMALLPIT